MSGLRFASPTYSDLSRQLLCDPSRESCAIGYTYYHAPMDVWVVAAVELVPDSAYEQRDAVSAVLRPPFLVEVANRARAGRFNVVLIHSHPWSKGSPDFSQVDDDGEVALAEYFNRRVSGGSHLALVVGPEGCRARRLGAGVEVPVWEVGETLVPHSERSADSVTGIEHDRQIRAFGEPGQRFLRSLSIGVVGVGGTGSATVQQLAHLGVQSFTLIDPDNIEITNLNRLIGAGPTDVGAPKVSIAARQIGRINPEARVRTLQRDVVDADVASQLTGLDFLFLCTDSHASRAVVGQIAYQYLVPTIDMGVSIIVRDGAVSHVTGRVQMLSPGLTCLVCSQALDGEQIRQELLTPEQRAADPYVQGVHEPQPAVVSINSTVASLAVTMFLGAATPVPAGARFQLYDGIRGTVRPTSASKVPNCIVCSSAGALTRGPSWALPVRPAERPHE